MSDTITLNFTMASVGIEVKTPLTLSREDARRLLDFAGERAGVLPTTDPDYFKELLNVMCMEAVGHHTRGISGEVRGYREALDAYENLKKAIVGYKAERDHYQKRIHQAEIKGDNELEKAVVQAINERDEARAEVERLKKEARDNKCAAGNWEIHFRQAQAEVKRLKAPLKELREATDLNNKSFWAECPEWLKQASCGTPHVAMKIMVAELEAADQGVLRMRGKS